ncbi:hypothetical protein GCM10018775_40110 [Streptomyces umbrinus]|nr:hypothetical protein GCM10018775_40110 [Streptomyces umbrinus]
MAGASKSRSSTACTSVPRVAASLGFSGSLSITRKRYSNGHCMKSPAREGDNEAGGTATVTRAGSAATTGSAAGEDGACTGTSAGTAGLPVGSGRGPV